MFHFLELPQNILLFCQALRGRQVEVTTDAVLVALRGLRFINIRHKTDFYTLLKTSFVSRREDVKPFDEVFEKFWSLSEGVATPLEGRAEPKAETHREEGEDDPSTPFYEEEGFRFRDRTAGSEERTRVEQEDVLEYSPDEVLRVKDFSSLSAEELEEIKEYVARLSRNMALILSRRWKSGRRQGQIDFRRTIRHSIRHGGEIVQLRWKKRKTRPLRIVFLCDVSGSMDIYSQFVLLFMYAIQNFYPHCETLAFSTRLTHVSDILKKKKTFDEVLSFLSKELLDWSGGTNIGGALRELRRRHPGFLQPNRTVLLIFSDGWERGDAALLDFEMKSLKLLTRKLIWLNPHLGTPNYQPLCKGMATALPYLDYFLPCRNLASLGSLSNLVSKM